MESIKFREKEFILQAQNEVSVRLLAMYSQKTSYLKDTIQNQCTIFRLSVCEDLRRDLCCVAENAEMLSADRVEMGGRLGRKAWELPLTVLILSWWLTSKISRDIT